MREVIFIQMTPSGFLSAIRDGRLPDACHPSKLLLDPRSSEHENSSDDEPSPDPLKQTTGAAAGNAKAAGKKRKRGTLKKLYLRALFLSYLNNTYIITLKRQIGIFAFLDFSMFMLVYFYYGNLL